MLSTGSRQEDPFQHKRTIVDWDVKNQIKKTNFVSKLHGFWQTPLTISCPSGLNQYSAADK